MDTSRQPEPKLYGPLAEWFHLLTPPEEYVEEAALYGRLLDAAGGDVRTVLELGSGGGNNASHLKARYELTLVDLAPAMLEVSRRLNPECEHRVGDMRSVRLDRRFDAVFVHDAVSYLTTVDDLRSAMATARLHLRDGGAALFAPDDVRESFVPGTDHGGVDDGERGVRYLEWSWDPDPGDSAFFTEYAYLLRESSEVRVVHDRHVCGLFSTNEWVQSLRDTGFRQVDVQPGIAQAPVFVAIR